MQLMKTITFCSLLFACLTIGLVTGCSKNDRQMMNGVWTLKEVYSNGRALYSADEKRQRHITDSIIALDRMMAPPDGQSADGSDARRMFEQESKMRSALQLEFSPDRTFRTRSRTYEGKLVIERGKTTVDEKKEEIVFRSDVESKTASYVVDEKELRLYLQQENGLQTLLVFERKK